jgi:hypothetical protein
MSKVYIYVVARDFGFAPNPFHGVCTLATCKPRIRRKALGGDWVIGMAGTKLRATGRCVFAMQVTQTSNFDDYWSDPAFFDKRSVRNGTRKMLVGDNIYHKIHSTGDWQQADSHHSLPDGSPDKYNVARDTATDRVLISRHFFYFGSNAPPVPAHFLSQVGYKNAIGHRVFDYERCRTLIRWLHETHGKQLNEVSGPPFQFRQSHARYSVKTDKFIL